MKKQIIYEWVIEQIDPEGDIIDCDYYESFSKIPKNNIGNTIGLCKTTYHPVAGVLNRTYAYVKNNTPPTTFDNGDKIPNDLAIEFIKIENNQSR
jgi:hypothetical protein